MTALADPARLQALARTELMESGAEEVFGRLARLAARLLDVRVAQITVLSADRQHVKGTSADIGEAPPIEQSYCRHVVEGDRPFVVADVVADARFPDPTGYVEAELVTYCGVPLIDSDGHTLGSLCAMNDRPREWPSEDLALLRELASAAMAEIELRASNRRLRRSEAENIELHAREALLAKVVEDSAEGIGSVDRDGRITAWNRGCEQIYGVPADEAIGRLLWEAVAAAPGDDGDPAAASGVQAIITRALSGETLQVVAVPRRHRAGHVVYIDLAMAPMRDAAGAIVGVTATARDVSENRRLVEELRASELRARRTFDDAPTGITLIAPDRTVIDANRAFCEMTGFRREELVGRTLEHLTHPEDHGNDLAGVEAMLSGESSQYQVEKRYRRRDGREVRVTLSASMVCVEDGAPQYFIVHTEDVTAAREAQAALTEAQELLDESQSVAQIGSWSFDLQTSTYTWSRELRLLHGLAPDAPAPTPAQLMRLVVAEDRAALRGRMSALGDDPRDFAGEYRVKLPDGSVRTLWCVGRMLPGDPASGRGPRLTGTTQDISAMRDAERSRRAVEERHGRLLAALPDTMVALYDTDMRCQLMQGGLLSEAGIEPARYIGRRLEDSITSEQAEVLPPLIQRALAGESVTIDHDTGRGRQFQIEVAPYPGEDGEIAGAFTVWRDITARLREQAARREVEGRLRVTVEHAPIGVALVDLGEGARGRLLSVNAPFAALLDEPDPVAAGVLLGHAVHPEDGDALSADLARLAADDGARTETELRCVHADGRIVWLLVTGAAVPAPDGRPRMAVLHALDIGERKRLEGRLRHLADHDALTGLVNRRRLDSELQRAVSIADRYGNESALLILDLDGFKRINDTFGHSYGDELLMRVASCLRANLRSSDVIARLGGDEFAAVLPVVSPEAASVVAEKLLQAISRDGAVVCDGQRASVTASIGVVPFTAGDSRDADALLIEADGAMYAAKDAGRDRVVIARRDANGHPLITARRPWLTRLREALDGDRFELYAQPIRRVDGGGPELHELLLRMRDDDGEIFPPAAFLPHAERFGLIGEIDRWVFARAAAMLAERPDADLHLSVNVSGRTLSDATLLADLRETITACPIPPGRLIVEVTETAAISDIAHARDIARGLRTLGCRFALDDFGSGFASYYYLKHLEFDYLKIDGEFIRSLAVNPADRLVVRSVVELARGFGARTIAEFVGDAATVEVLRELGVDYGQGFHLGRPAPAEEVLPAVSRPRVASRA